MKIATKLFLAAAFRLAATLPAETALHIRPLPVDSSLPVIPWVADGDSSWTRGEPTFTIVIGEHQASASGWAALSDTAFLLHVIVRDLQHHHENTGANLWNGDSLQIAVDALGDGAWGMPENTQGPMGPDDIALGLALTSNGPEGWIFFQHRSLGRGGPLPAGSVEVSREGDSTRYTLRLPWSHLGVQPGISPHLGLAVQLNDSTLGAATQARGFFGRGADGVPRPGLHQRLTSGTPPGSLRAAAALNTAVWNSARPGQVRVALKADTPLTLHAVLGDQTLTRAIPADGQVHRFDLVARPDTDGQSLRLNATAPDGNVVFEHATAFIVPEAVLFRLLGKIDAKLAANPHPLFARHLQSIRSLCLTEWARLGLYAQDNPQMATGTLERIRGIEIGLDGDSGEWEAYLDGRRSLVMAYNSPHDSTLQYYMLNLPRDWNPEKTYPLFFELHGAGDNNPISLLAGRLALDPETPQLHGYESPKTFAEIQRNGYHVHPWGRGNLGYRGISEIDILEAYDDAHKHFRIDENRRYLYGFSMGGGGTWSLGLRTPDRWAAIAIFAGSSRRDPPGLGIAMNATGLPVWIWCGEEDRLFPDMGRMVAELQSFGIEPVTSTTPGLGHNYTMAKQEEGLNWLQQFSRKRPDTFRFRADADSHTGIWGIHMTRNPVLSALPTFECRIEGQTVSITSEGTTSLTLDPGPGGLNLRGDISVIWQGQTVYAGPAARLRLQDGTATVIMR